jgi:hypothetical protein
MAKGCSRWSGCGEVEREEGKSLEAVKGSAGEEGVGEALADCWFWSKQTLSRSTQPIHPYIFQLSTSIGLELRMRSVGDLVQSAARDFTGLRGKLALLQESFS